MIASLLVIRKKRESHLIELKACSKLRAHESYPTEVLHVMHGIHAGNSRATLRAHESDPTEVLHVMHGIHAGNSRVKLRANEFYNA